MKLFHSIIGFAAAFSVSVAVADNAPLKYYNDATIPTFNSRTPMNAPAAKSDSRLMTLDVMGIGLSVEMFRQSKAWEELQKHPKDSILPSDLSKYPTNEKVKELATEKRAADVLEYGASHFVEHWPIPNVSIFRGSMIASTI